MIGFLLRFTSIPTRVAIMLTRVGGITLIAVSVMLVGLGVALAVSGSGSASVVAVFVAGLLAALAGRAMTRYAGYARMGMRVD